MKILMTILCLMIMTICCSGNSASHDLTWYDHSSVTNITEDLDRPEEFVRISIGISAQVFYISKKSMDYKNVIEKATDSFKNNKLYHIGIENKTNIIREIKEVK